MKKENEQEAISNLQRYLRRLSFTDGDIPAPPVDGVFGSVTANAVAAFQKKYSLPVTGTADRRTWDALYAAYIRATDENSAPYTVSFFPRIPLGYSLGSGDSGFVVSVLQHLLREITVIHDEFPELAVTGVFDEPTQEAVTLFQSRNMLPSTGLVDRRTWNALVNTYHHYADGYVQ